MTAAPRPSSSVITDAGLPDALRGHYVARRTRARDGPAFPESSMNRPSRTRSLLPLSAAALSLLLAACGGGGGGGTSATGLSAADAQATSANAIQGGDASSTSLDNVYDMTLAITSASAGAMSTSFRSGAQSAAPGTADGASPQATSATSATVPCVGGGTATITISGGTLLTQLNGQFDPGEHYELAFAQCGGSLGLMHLDGSVAMDILSVGTGTPAVTSAALTMTALKATIGLATTTLDGHATLDRSVDVNGLVTTATSHVTASSFSMATTWNQRSGSFTVTNLDATHVTTWTGGILSGSTLAGHHTLSGTANGRTIDETVSLTGEVAFDAAGNPVSGAWTSVRPDATVTTTVANGVAVVTVDDGNDGTIDHTWTITVATLMASAG